MSPNVLMEACFWNSTLYDSGFDHGDHDRLRVQQHLGVVLGRVWRLG